MRTKSEVVLAVVCKKELLDCRGELDLQTLKASARSVRIKVTVRNEEGSYSTTVSYVWHKDTLLMNAYKRFRV